MHFWKVKFSLFRLSTFHYTLHFEFCALQDTCCMIAQTTLARPMSSSLIRDFVPLTTRAHANYSVQVEFTPCQSRCLHWSYLPTALRQPLGSEGRLDLFALEALNLNGAVLGNVWFWAQQGDVLPSPHITGWGLEIRKDEGLTGLCAWVRFLTWERQSWETGRAHFSFPVQESRVFRRSCGREPKSDIMALHSYFKL